MRAFADPLVPLLQLRRDVLEGSPIDPACLDNGYLKLNQDFPNGGERRCFAKIHNGAPIALAIFGLESPIEGIRCYSVGYAVIEELRGRGLALEAVNRGLSELKVELRRSGINRFYLEAMVAKTNLPSIRVAKALFSQSGQSKTDSESGQPAWLFRKKIEMA